MSGGALVCDKREKKEENEKKRNIKSRTRIVFFVRLVRARFVIAKSAASSIKWTMMMGRRATCEQKIWKREKNDVEYERRVAWFLFKMKNLRRFSVSKKKDLPLRLPTTSFADFSLFKFSSYFLFIQILFLPSLLLASKQIVENNYEIY